MDPTLPVTTLPMTAPKTSYRELKKLYQKQARHRSHYNFIRLCLQNNIVPNGLRINKQPTVPDTTRKRAFLKKWDGILLKTSRTLLKQLKIYHQEAVALLAGEIADRRAKLQKRQDFDLNMRKINQFTTQITGKYENIKKKKIEKLVGTRIRKCCRRKNRTKQPKQLIKTNHNTVVNISNFSLSEAERDLLSRGLSFCLRPSQIDQFQLKEDIQQFFRRL